MKPFMKKPTPWKVGLICLFFAAVGTAAALIGGEDSSALIFPGPYPVASQIVCCAAVGALGVFFMIRSKKEKK